MPPRCVDCGEASASAAAILGSTGVDTTATLGKGAVKDVLIQDMIQQ